MTVNESIAAKLRDMADVLEQQDASPFRVSAYRRAAASIETMGEGVDAILARKGRDGLIALPGIGAGIASAVAEMSAHTRLHHGFRPCPPARRRRRGVARAAVCEL